MKCSLICGLTFAVMTGFPFTESFPAALDAQEGNSRSDQQQLARDAMVRLRNLQQEKLRALEQQQGQIMVQLKSVAAMKEKLEQELKAVDARKNELAAEFQAQASDLLARLRQQPGARRPRASSEDKLDKILERLGQIEKRLEELEKSESRKQSKTQGNNNDAFDRK